VSLRDFKNWVDKRFGCPTE